MAEDNNLIVKIVLDDGSIQNGFIKIEKKAAETADNTKKEFKSIGDVFETDVAGAITKSLKSVPIATAGIAIGVAAIGFALKEAFDLSVEGEKIKAVEKQFNAIAAGAGLVGEELRTSLEKSAAGLIDTTELLSIANKNIINLGDNAAKLPEVLDLSRKVALALGQPLADTFAGISSGIETGNAKVLRSNGIIIDSEKAFRDYAKTIGLTGSELNKAQQQQAILNAVLTQGGEKFKDVQSGITPLNKNIKLFSVAMTEAREQFAIFVSNNFAGAFVAIAEAAKQAFQAINTKDATGLQKQANDAADLKAKIFQLQSTIQNYENSLNQGASAFERAFGTSSELKAIQTKQRIRELKEELDKTTSAFDAIANSSSTAGKAIGEALPEKQSSGASVAKLSEEQVRAIADRNAQIQDLNLKAQQDFINVQQSQVDSLGTYEQQQQAVLDIQRQQELLNEETFQKAKADIATKYSDEKGFTEEQRARASEALDFDQSNKRVALETATNQKLKAIQDASFKQRIAGFSSFFGNLATLQESSSKELAAVGKAAALAQATIDGYAAIVGAYKNGASIPGGGPALGAAFAAAAAAATAIQISKIASVGGGGGGASYSPDTAGGGGNAGGGVTPPTGVTGEQDRNVAGAKVDINIEGNVMNSRDSALYIADILNEQFKSGGGNVLFGAS